MIDYPIFTGAACTQEEGIIQGTYTGEREENGGWGCPRIPPTTTTSITSSYLYLLYMSVEFSYLKQDHTSYFKHSYRY